VLYTSCEVKAETAYEAACQVLYTSCEAKADPAAGDDVQGDTVDQEGIGFSSMANANT
jgi:hypothetical protein